MILQIQIDDFLKKNQEADKKQKSLKIVQNVIDAKNHPVLENSLQELQAIATCDEAGEIQFVATYKHPQEEAKQVQKRVDTLDTLTNNISEKVEDMYLVADNILNIEHHQ